MRTFPTFRMQNARHHFKSKQQHAFRESGLVSYMELRKANRYKRFISSTLAIWELSFLLAVSYDNDNYGKHAKDAANEGPASPRNRCIPIASSALLTTGLRMRWLCLAYFCKPRLVHTVVHKSFGLRLLGEPRSRSSLRRTRISTPSDFLLAWH